MKMTTFVACAAILMASVSTASAASPPDDSFNWGCYFSPISCYFGPIV